MAQTLAGLALGASITANDLDRSVAWYCETLGFSIERRYEREGKLFGVALRAGEVEILLTQDDGGRGTDRAKGQGISLMITTSDPVDSVAARVRETGWSLDSEPIDLPGGRRGFRVRDPDGFRIAVSSPRG